MTVGQALKYNMWERENQWGKIFLSASNTLQEVVGSSGPWEVWSTAGPLHLWVFLALLSNYTQESNHFFTPTASMVKWACHCWDYWANDCKSVSLPLLPVYSQLGSQRNLSDVRSYHSSFRNFRSLHFTQSKSSSLHHSPEGPCSITVHPTSAPNNLPLFLLQPQGTPCLISSSSGWLLPGAYTLAGLQPEHSSPNTCMEPIPSPLSSLCSNLTYMKLTWIASYHRNPLSSLQNDTTVSVIPCPFPPAQTTI